MMTRRHSEGVDEGIAFCANHRPHLYFLESIHHTVQICGARNGTGLHPRNQM
jgi:hypothetical protein